MQTIEEKREYTRLWQLRNKEKMRGYGKTRRNKLENKIYHRNYVRQYAKTYYSKENPIQRAMHLKRKRDQQNIRKKIIADRKVCENCGSNIKLELHHLDYTENNHILLLCKNCHSNLHMQIKCLKEVK